MQHRVHFLGQQGIGSCDPLGLARVGPGHRILLPDLPNGAIPFSAGTALGWLVDDSAKKLRAWHVRQFGWGRRRGIRSRRDVRCEDAERCRVSELRSQVAQILQTPGLPQQVVGMKIVNTAKQEEAVVYSKLWRNQRKDGVEVVAIDADRAAVAAQAAGKVAADENAEGLLGIGQPRSDWLGLDVENRRDLDRGERAGTSHFSNCSLSATLRQSGYNGRA